MAKVIARHDWATPVAKVLRGLWTDGYAVGWLSAGALLAHHGVATKADAPTVSIGVDWGSWTPGDTDAAKQILGRNDALGHLLSLVDTGDTVADQIVVNRMDRLAGVLIDGLEKGLAPDAIARQLTSVLGDKQWAHLVALTETTRAVSEATLQQYQRNGVEAISWMTAEDQRVCTPCQENEAASPIPLSDKSSFPNGAYPPQHPLCRCSLAPDWMTANEAAAQGADLSGLGGSLVSDEELAQLGTTVASALADEESVVAEAAAGAGAGGATTREMTQVTVRDELLAAKSPQQVAKVFMDQARQVTGRDIPSEFRGSVQTAREHAEGLLRGLERFPEADLFKVEAAFLGDTSYAEAEGGVMRFNNYFTSDRRDYLAKLAKDVNSRWHPAGMDNPAGIALHEFGHILDIETLGEMARADITSIIEDRVDEGLISGRFVQGADRDIMRDLVARLDISRYAADGGELEIAAEAFADVMLNGSAASDLSREIYDAIRAQYEAGGRVLNTTARVRAEARAGGQVTLTALRAQAREAGIRGFSRMSRDELEAALRPAATAAVNDAASVLDRIKAASSREEADALLEGKTVAQIKDIYRAGDLPITGRTKAQLRADLIDMAIGGRLTTEAFTAAFGRVAETAAAQDLSRMTVAQLRTVAKDRGLTGYSKLTKPQLLERLAGEAKPVEQTPALNAQQVAAADRRAALEAATKKDTGTFDQTLYGGMSADTRVLGTGDDAYVLKRYGGRYQMDAAELKWNIDSEVLGPQILDAMGGRGAATIKLSKDSVAVDFIKGTHYDAYTSAADKAEVARLAATDEGRVTGLMSYITGHADLNDGNWILADDGHLVVYDFPGIFSDAFTTVDEMPVDSFTGYLQRGGSGFDKYELAARVDWNPADLAVMRSRLEALRPQFAAARRVSWYNKMMQRLAEVQKRADPAAPIRLG